MALTFIDAQHYEASGQDGSAAAGQYKLAVGSANFHRIEWDGRALSEAGPLPTRFRYFETRQGRTASRMAFYAYRPEDLVNCER